MFSVNYQLALNDVYGLRALATCRTMRSLKVTFKCLGDMLSPEKAIRFSRVTDRIYIDADMDELVGCG